jgi:small multidrug resistance pump
MGFIYLAIAIVAEVIATMSLKASAGFTKPWPSLVVVLGYATAFYFLALVLKTVPIGIAYAIWAGLGIVLTTVAAAFIFKQVPDRAAVLGITLIVAGVIVLNAFSTSTGHDTEDATPEPEASA